MAADRAAAVAVVVGGGGAAAAALAAAWLLVVRFRRPSRPSLAAAAAEAAPRLGVLTGMFGICVPRPALADPAVVSAAAVVAEAAALAAAEARALVSIRAITLSRSNSATTELSKPIKVIEDPRIEFSAEDRAKKKAAVAKFAAVRNAGSAGCDHDRRVENKCERAARGLATARRSAASGKC